MKLNLQNFLGLTNPATQKIFQVFASHGLDIRFVGGCVRDAILNIDPKDIDMAVPVPPDVVMDVFNRANIKVIPTGYEFGTVTALLENREFQVTSLRRDYQTDGRHAKVIYGTDWKQDAARRDFTINALYANAEGDVTDFFKGIDDLKSGTIRFIGDARQRIQEDYLRILRYFRFLALYGNWKNTPDLEAVQACTLLKDGIQKLSRERIGVEFLKLLSVPMPLQSLRLMNECDITPCIFHSSFNVDKLERLLDLQKESHMLLRLATLCLPSLSITNIVKALRLSRKQQNYLKTCLMRLPFYPTSESTFHQNLYKDSPELFLDLTFLALAISPVKQPHKIIDFALKACANWQQPLFPLDGNDLLKMGMQPGVKIGNLLNECKNWWIDQHFKPDRTACLQWVLEKRR